MSQQGVARFSTRTKCGSRGDIFRHYLRDSCYNRQIVVAYTLSCITKVSDVQRRRERATLPDRFAEIVGVCWHVRMTLKRCDERPFRAK
jgi:hypothetical protein